MDDRRKNERGPAEIEINYRTAQEFLSAYSQNISGGGVFVQTARLLALNDEVLLRFTLPGVPHRFEVPGLVVWSNPTMKSATVGMGIKFIKIPPAEAQMIDEFVKKALAPASDKKS
jgi:uncharacterized protein (TIGR02266 family)